jgi:hypothetical protein
VIYNYLSQPLMFPEGITSSFADYPYNGSVECNLGINGFSYIFFLRLLSRLFCNFLKNEFKGEYPCSSTGH